MSTGREERSIEALLRAGQTESFAPGFAGRVMLRLRREEEAGGLVPLLLQRYFFRLAPAVALVVLLLAVLNVRAAGAGTSRLEAVLGVPAVTLADAYTLDPTAEVPPMEAGG